MIKVSDGNGESNEAALREHLEAMVQANKGRPIRFSGNSPRRAEEVSQSRTPLAPAVPSNQR
jgi:hypothetical protein